MASRDEGSLSLREDVPALDSYTGDRYRRCMAQSIFVFDFGTNEEAAQLARHKVESWKQGFRLGNKMLVKFDREELSARDNGDEGAARKHSGAEKKTAAKKSAERDDKGSLSRISLLVRLDFSDHEKLSHQRWLDRVPNEEPFKSAKGETVRTGDPEFPKIAERFESLD
jgi:hypothetical protein